MGERQPNFEGQVAEKFVDGYYDSVRGYVRQEVTRRNILEHIAGRQNLRVADIGGGAGGDSIWLANLGHDVTLVEPSADMLAKTPPNIEEFADVVEGTAATLVKEGKAGSYDLVLSHCVTMYNLKNPAEEVKLLASLLNRGGHLSFLNTNYNARLHKTKDRLALEELRTSGQYINGIGVRAVAFTIPQAKQMINSAGTEIVDWYGVRINTDEDIRSPETLSDQHLKWLVDQEQQSGRDRHLRGLAQLNHFIARKI